MPLVLPSPLDVKFTGCISFCYFLFIKFIHCNCVSVWRVGVSTCMPWCMYGSPRATCGEESTLFVHCVGHNDKAQMVRPCSVFPYWVRLGFLITARGCHTITLWCVLVTIPVKVEHFPPTVKECICLPNLSSSYWRFWISWEGFNLFFISVYLKTLKSVITIKCIWILCLASFPTSLSLESVIRWPTCVGRFIILCLFCHNWCFRTVIIIIINLF